MTASHSSGDILNTMRSRRIPALFTTVSSRPHVSSAAAMSDFAPDSSETSSKCATASPPVAWISSTTCDAGLLSWPVPSHSPPRSLTTTRAPCSTNNRASPRPIPLPAPVITATFPSSIPIEPNATSERLVDHQPEQHREGGHAGDGDHDRDRRAEDPPDLLGARRFSRQHPAPRPRRAHGLPHLLVVRPGP